MDGISAAASVAGILTIAVQTIVITKQYIESVRNADQVVAVFLEELETLADNLNRLKNFLTRQPDTSFTSTSSLLTRMTSSKKNLQKLKSKLDHTTMGRLHRYKWPLSEKEHRQTIQDIRAFSQWIELSLSLDSVVILTKSSEEIAKVLSISMESMKLLDTISSQTVSVEQSVEAQRMAQKKKDLLSWLSNYDTRIKHQHAKALRVKGTGKWLLSDSRFLNWMSREPGSNMLWCFGSPGVGKTVLSSLVIDYLIEDDVADDGTVATAYIYFEDQNSKILTPTEVCGNLAKQILSASSTVPESVWQIYQTSHEKKLDLSIAKAVLLHSLSAHQKTRIIIDALDECQETDQRGLILDLLRTLSSRSDVSLLVTSRNHCHDITKASENAPQLQILAQEQDLRIFLSSKIEAASIGDEIDESFKTEIISKIISKSGQMFLLAKLQIDAVLDASSPGDMEDACEVLPSTLDEAFDRTIIRIKAQSEATADLAMKALLWLTFTKPGSFLRIADLQQILASKPDQEPAKARYYPWPQKIVQSCQGLVTIDQGIKRVRFTHLAMREYLVKRAHNLLPDAQESISRTIIQYLSMVTALETTFESQAQLQDTIVSYPFLWYAATNWAYHSSMCPGSDVVDSVEALLLMGQRRNSIHQIHEYLRGRRKLYWSAKEAQSNTILHTAALFGLEKIVYRLLDSPGTNIDETTSIGTTALMKAASAGHPQIVQLLLDRGASIKLMNWFGNALHCAAEAGKVNAIRVLVEHERFEGIDVLNPGNHSALECAIAGRHHAAAQTLHAMGARDGSLTNQSFRIFTSSDEQGHDWTIYTSSPSSRKMVHAHPACFVAIVANQLDFAQLLLSSGANPNAIPSYGGCLPLAWCAWYEDDRAAKFLLEAGAEVSARSGFGREQGRHEHTAYWYAYIRGNKKTMQLLLDFGAIPEISRYSNDIQVAEKGMNDITERLLSARTKEETGRPSKNKYACSFD